MSNMAMNEYQKMGQEIMAEEEAKMKEKRPRRRPGYETDGDHGGPADGYGMSVEEANAEHRAATESAMKDKKSSGPMTYEDAYVAMHGSMDAGGGDADVGAAFKMMIDNNVGWDSAAAIDDLLLMDPDASEEEATMWAQSSPEVRMKTLQELASGAPTNMMNALQYNSKNNK